ncbi:MAG: hypothetical protein ACYCTK_08100, partial [Acidithiobacillus ferrooxidans]
MTYFPVRGSLKKHERHPPRTRVGSVLYYRHNHKVKGGLYGIAAPDFSEKRSERPARSGRAVTRCTA